jgi:hypothetical protein
MGTLFFVKFENAALLSKDNQPLTPGGMSFLKEGK